MTQHSHRPSSLKQRNKKFKKKVAAVTSAAAHKEVEKRKLAAPLISAALRPINKHGRASVTKQKRVRQLQQLQGLKVFLKGAAACGHAALPPRVVLIVSFDEQTDSRYVFSLLASQLRKDLQLGDTHPSARYNPLENINFTSVSGSAALDGLSSQTFLFPLPPYARCPTLPLRLQQRVLLLPAPPTSELLPLLDLCKCADVLLCLFSGECTYTKPAFDESGYRFLTALKMQGVPLVIGVGSPTLLRSDAVASTLIRNAISQDEMNDISMDDTPVIATKPSGGATMGKVEKRQAAERLKFQQRYFLSEFGTDRKFCSVASPMEWQKVIRAVGGANVPPDVASGTGGGGASAFSPSAGDLQWRRGRGYVLGLDWEIVQKNGQPRVESSGDHPVTDGSHNDIDKDSEADEAYLQVYGFVRGVGMTCRSFSLSYVSLPVHVTGVGDFIAEKVEVVYGDEAADKRRQKRKLRLGGSEGGSSCGPVEDCDMDGGNVESQHTQQEDQEENEEASQLPCLDEENLTDTLRAELLASMRPLQPFDPTILEQTWPTEAELAESEQKKTLARKCRRIRVPKDVSEYERSWYEEEVDDEDDGASDKEEDQEEAMKDEEDAAEGEEEEDDQWQSDMGIDGSAEKDMEQAKEDMAKKLNFTIEQRAAEDLQFPDEVDTPLDVEARVRFQKYRGLKSFRTSFWNKDEDLPVAYARVVDFERYKAMASYARNELRRLCSANAFQGRFCRIRIPLHFCPSASTETQPADPEAPLERCTKAQLQEIISKIRQAASCSGRSTPDTEQSEGLTEGKREKGFLVLSTLLPYESAVSVLHLQLTRGGSYTASLKGKEELIFNCGFRRFVGRPIYSTDRGAVMGRGSHTDKVQMLRFFHPGTSCVASLYAPTLFPPASVVVYKRTNTEQEVPGNLELCAWGSVVNSNSNRLIIKRIVLTGYPFKVHRRKAVVRFMFFNPKDIRWFSPVELHTKKGLRGNIMQPLGTHGYMKCKFNQHIKQDDTVCMYLYKRVFPKWHPPTWGGVPSLLPSGELAPAGSEDLER
ncbi:ribosome biogenesis protein [Cystoisospora suis]|uniref:Ribosome biogenesis protein n=1 Tax=Cystoisospora suis TaxID=483139 RepID=A0A2C6K5F1_9APIC|nr:ribosome biogenesis protein [Cystoisospora suis]